MSSPQVQSAARRKKKKNKRGCILSRSSGETRSDYRLQSDVGKEGGKNKTKQKNTQLQQIMLETRATTGTEHSQQEKKENTRKTKHWKNQFPFSYINNFLWTGSLIAFSEAINTCYRINCTYIQCVQYELQYTVLTILARVGEVGPRASRVAVTRSSQ